MYGSIELAQRIVGCAMRLESRFKTEFWYARVPSHSNISNGPSGLDFEEVGQLGSKQIEIDWEIILENLFGFRVRFQKGESTGTPNDPQLLWLEKKV